MEIHPIWARILKFQDPDQPPAGPVESGPSSGFDHPGDSNNAPPLTTTDHRGTAEHAGEVETSSPTEIIAKCSFCKRRVRLLSYFAFDRLRNQIVSMIERIWPEAQRLGWEEKDLFLVRQRVDRMGLVGFLSPGDKIGAVTADVIEVRTVTGSVLRFRRQGH